MNDHQLLEYILTLNHLYIAKITDVVVDANDVPYYDPLYPPHYGIETTCRHGYRVKVRKHI